MQRKYIYLFTLLTVISGLISCRGEDNGDNAPQPVNNINWDQMQWDKDNWSSLVPNNTEMPS